MPRKPRIQFDGATYHVMCRGDRQEDIFKDSSDCWIFLDTLGEVCDRCGWLIHAFVLMKNHYHLLIETPEANLVDGMRWFQGTYTQRFNTRHKLAGHLFQGRYKSLLVDGEGDYFPTVAIYIHLNPVRGQCFDSVTGRLSDYPWSSHTGYLQPSCRPKWLIVDRVLSSLGFEDTPLGRSEYAAYMQQRVREVSEHRNLQESEARWDRIRRGWAFGSEEFRQKIGQVMDDVMVGRRRDSFAGGMVKKHDEHRAEQLLVHGLNICALRREELEQLKKGDARKKVIAWHIRRNTSVRNEWISKVLKMGNVSNVSRYIRSVEEAGDGYINDLKRKMTK